MAIRDVRVDDAGAICQLYNEHVLNTIVTFENVPVDVVEMESRILQVTADYPWLVIEQDGEFQGYAYGTQWRERKAYQHTVETAIYMDSHCQRQGLGGKLYRSLLDRLSRGSTFHVAIGAIALPNPASVGLHEKLGFRRVALFSQVGRKFDRWIDVGFWQYDL